MIFMLTNIPKPAAKKIVEFCFGAQGGIRTRKPCGVPTSRVCVCQFRHLGILLTYN